MLNFAILKQSRGLQKRGNDKLTEITELGANINMFNQKELSD